MGWNKEKIEASRVRLIREKKGTYDEEKGLFYYERIVRKGDYLYFQTIVKEPTFSILSSTPLFVGALEKPTSKDK